MRGTVSLRLGVGGMVLLLFVVNRLDLSVRRLGVGGMGIDMTVGSIDWREMMAFKCPLKREVCRSVDGRA